ncbi:hypothetical protein GCM10025782_08760 [Pedococcus ginsenosidimutans]|uniref:Uncharacterized protein n=2 Tax=Pedococcus ginsenosidimutans TaxID=490570 RepID=A0ABP8XS56_9MICO
MLARPDYLIPLAAAERQFRDHYYGLNSAALLEDLFFDALGNYIRQVEPSTRLTRPPTGQKGWDYAFDGLQISHKVSQSLSEIAALWDATKKGVDRWSFDDPIVYVLGSNTPPGSLLVEVDTATSLRCRAVADLGRPYVAEGKTLLVLRWPADGSQPHLLDIVPTEKGQTVADALSFSRVWRHVAAHVASGRGANEIDVVATSKRCPPLLVEALLTDGLPTPVDLSVTFRGGVYLLPRELLQDLTVTTNNRAILIPKETIKTLLHEASIRGLFAPVPLWYWVYAQERPPDMYSAQRGEYDTRFSARGNIDPV